MISRTELRVSFLDSTFPKLEAAIAGRYSDEILAR